MATWTFTVNDAFAEHVGPDGVAALVSVLRSTAAAAPGRSVESVRSALDDALSSAAVNIAEPERDRIATNLALPDLEDVVVADGRGAQIAHIPVANDASALPRDERSENVHIEPGDPSRPAIS